MLDDRLHIVAEAVIQKTLASLPAPVRAAAQGCVIEPVLMTEVLASGEEMEDDLLGLFEGCSLADEEAAMPGHLPRIRLFLDNLWDYADGSTDVFRDEVRVTLLHELGHYLGFDEDQVADRGLA